MTKKRFLFVCVENSNRSQMAEAFARMHGGESVEAYSAGSRPSGVVNPKAIASMAEIGYDLSRHVSKSLDEIPPDEYDFVATMGCGDACPFIGAKQRADWQIPDPKNLDADEFRKIRDLIEGKVKRALANRSNEHKRARALRKIAAFGGVVVRLGPTQRKSMPSGARSFDKPSWPLRSSVSRYGDNGEQENSDHR